MEIDTALKDNGGDRERSARWHDHLSASMAAAGVDGLLDRGGVGADVATGRPEIGDIVSGFGRGDWRRGCGHARDE
jgi:hypothetical protein